MTIWTLCRYLLGDRDAILAIASSRHALWVGLLFVMSAGFAREYDGEDLLHEPWHLLIPLAVSLPASALLFVMVQYLANGGTLPWRALASYPSFLGLFWMTAPLAWLYAIPYDRFFSARLATDLDLCTLGVVAAWRVALMVRVVDVCTRLPIRTAAAAVLLFACGAATLAAQAVGVELLAVMGGLRDHVLTAFQSGAFGIAGLLVAVGGIVSLLYCITHAYRDCGWDVPADSGGGVSGGLAALMAVSLCVWVAFLPFTQPQQQRRREVERALARGHVAEAVALLATHPREAFPPRWRPSPRRTGGRPRKEMELIREVLAECQRQGGPEWVKDLYEEQLASSWQDERRGE